MIRERARRKEQTAPPTRLAEPYLIARFIRFYGIGAWVNASYPTADHHIPWKLFVVYVAMMAHVDAAEQLSAYYAALLAGAMIHGGDEGKASREGLLEQLAAQANPKAPGLLP